MQEVAQVKRTIHKSLYKSLIAHLVESRKKAKLTQQDVADQLGRPQSYVAKIERAERRLDVIEYIELALVLGLSPSKPICELARRAQLENQDQTAHPKKKD